MLGVIADDFTGASDVASFLANEGVATILYSGVPSHVDASCRAAVIALKTRTAPVQQAVGETLQAVERLERAGVDCFYIKYCSTFDSTPQGNIGPIVDAVMRRLGVHTTVLDPALPVNGRTVRDGILYVDGTPLAQSPMKDHPLTPMWDSRLSELMARQGQHKTVCVPLSAMADPAQTARLRDAATQEKRGTYFVPDHWLDEHAALIAERFGDMRLLTGGSALAAAWGRNKGGDAPLLSPHTAGRCMVLAGSCSVATRAQIRVWQQSGRPTFHLQPERMLENEQAEWERLMRFVEQKDGMIYTSAEPEAVEKMKKAVPNVDQRIEAMLGRLAVQGAAMGVKRWIVAGGETSGAVTRALGYAAFAIGPSVAPGVPVLTPIQNKDVRLVLKSGNFGQEDFFARAWRMTNADE